MGGLSGSVSLDHHADDDNVVGVDTAMDMWGMNLAPSVDWNVTDSQFNGEMKVSYGIAGIDASSTFKFDINEIVLELPHQKSKIRFWRTRLKMCMVLI